MSSLTSTNEFGLTTEDEFYTVNSGGELVLKVRRLDYGASTQSPGDIASLVYKGIEYQDQTRGSQVGAGFDWLYEDTSEVTVDAEVIDDTVVKVTVTAGYLTHYYLITKGEDKIFMGTYFTQQPDTQGNVRYILRTLYSLLPNGPAPSDLSDTTETIESSDIFGTATGETRSKHYSNQRLKDWSYIGATGDSVGVWIVRGNSEGMSGGPFYRSLLNQAGTDQEITYIVNYGMAQTEAYRTNILNLYTIVFSDGSEPDEPDLTWLSEMDLLGWVSDDKRGTVNCEGIDGLDGTSSYTVSFTNSAAMYWASVDNTTTAFTCDSMLPGEYVLTVFKNELAVLTGSATVSAGTETQLSKLSIEEDPSSDEYVWRIGEWDGSPMEFLNGDKVTIMHPTDVRMADWSPDTFVIDESIASESFPAYQCRNINNDIKISFNLTEDEIKSYRLRIGITISSTGGRPAVSINGWSENAATSTQPDTRSLTVGTYRGNNVMYTFDIPESAFAVGENIITIGVISGSSADGWLGPGFAYDAVDLIAI